MLHRRHFGVVAFISVPSTITLVEGYFVNATGRFLRTDSRVCHTMRGDKISFNITIVRLKYREDEILLMLKKTPFRNREKTFQRSSAHYFLMKEYHLFTSSFIGQVEFKNH